VEFVPKVRPHLLVTLYISDVWTFATAEAIQNHENLNICDIGKGEAQHRKYNEEA
jgi:hypothetical protein